MGKKIFVSYKYADKQVRALKEHNSTTVRNYVDILENKLDKVTDHIYMGEDDGEDMNSLADATIGSKLGDKIFQSSVTIVFISKGMKENKSEKDQWIPWEISYSLKEQSRQNQNSKTNAVLAVVLPDENNNYDYFIQDNTCPHCNCRTLHTNFLFKILKENMFNLKSPQFSNCTNHEENNRPYVGHSSFIYSVKWNDFIADIDKYVKIASEIRAKINEYDIKKNV